MKTSFEQGPIRPPNEARSLLLRVTRNCPWNQCLFCPVYKKRKFSLRTVSEIKEDIKTVRRIADEIIEISKNSGFGGNVTDQTISRVFNDSSMSQTHRSIASWLYFKTGACFLQDADNLIMKSVDLIEVLKYLRKKFPEITRVTTYSRSRTIARKSIETLTKIHKAGLDRVHIGLETGYDPLLKFIKKGVTAKQQIEAGRKVIQSGMDLSEYVMPGLGGQEMWKEHAVETAKVLNAIDPHFIRLRSLRIPKRVPLHEKLSDGTFTMQTDDMIAEEIKVFIETLDGISSTITSDHIMNLLEEVSGKLPGDKQKILDVIKEYQDLNDKDRLIFRIGRRGGSFRSTKDMTINSNAYNQLNDLITEAREKHGDNGVEKMISEMVDQYI